MDNPRGYMKGNGGGAVMLAAKGRMADVLKRMMAAKLKAKFGAAMGKEEDEMEEESKSGEMEMPEEESKSGESELPDDEMRKLLEMYAKLK